MRLKEVIKDILSIIAMLITLASIVATSKKGNHHNPDLLLPKRGSPEDLFQAQIIHNCSQPQTVQENIMIQHYRIIAPQERSFVDLGFPSEVVDGVSSVSGYYGSYYRYCELVIGGPSPAHEWFYTCSDQTQTACFIKIKFKGSYPPPPGDNSGGSLKEPTDP